MRTPEEIKEMIEALQDFINHKSEILGHIEFCRDGLSSEYEWLFYNAERVLDEKETKL